jgi:hypothetical protein
MRCTRLRWFPLLFTPGAFSQGAGVLLCLAVLAPGCEGPSAPAADGGDADALEDGGWIGPEGDGGTDAGDGAAADAEADAAPSPLGDDHGVTARNFQVRIPVGDNDDLPSGALVFEVVSGPSHGSATFDGSRRLVYSPPWEFVGQDALVYRVTTPTGTVGTAQVTIDVRGQEWLHVAGDLYRAQEVVHGPADSDPDHATVLRGVQGREHLAGYAGVGDQTLGVVWEGDDVIEVLPEGATWARLHQVADDGRVAGTFGTEGGETMGLVRATSGEVLPHAVPGASATEIHALDGSGGAVGSLRSTEAFEDDVPRAVRFDLTNPPSFDVIHVEDTWTESTAYGARGAETVAGAYRDGDDTQGFVRDGDGVRSVHPEGASWSEAYAVDGAGRIAGVARDPGHSPTWAFLLDGESTHRLTYRMGFETFVHAMDDGGFLAGAFHSPSGQMRGLLLAPLEDDALVPGTTVTPMDEPPNAKVSHACGHATVGPFRTLHASDAPGTSEVIDRTHVHYTIHLPGDGESHQGAVRYQVGRAASLSFFTDRAVPLRMRTLEGAWIPPHRAVPTSLCPTFAWIYEFQVPEGGTYLLHWGPTHHAQVAVVYEGGLTYP